VGGRCADTSIYGLMPRQLLSSNRALMEIRVCIRMRFPERHNGSLRARQQPGRAAWIVQLLIRRRTGPRRPRASGPGAVFSSRAALAGSRVRFRPGNLNLFCKHRSLILWNTNSNIMLLF
jgi:hypothetical protein